MILLNKLLEDGNTLFSSGRLEDAAYRYEYALKRLPRVKQRSSVSPATGMSGKAGASGDAGANASEAGDGDTSLDEETNDVFVQLKSHLLLNLSRTRRKQKKYDEAVAAASQVLMFKPDSYEALWARGKVKREIGALDDALIDLREALQMAPQNLELHRFTLRVKEEHEQRLSDQSAPKLNRESENISEISCLV